MTGYNWRNTLTDYAAISGVLAGFSITFIALILGGTFQDITFFGLSFGLLSVLLFGCAATFFISAAELFLTAKTYYIFDIPEVYYKELIDHLSKKLNRTEKNTKKEQLDKCRHYEKYGRILYNTSIFLLSVGLFFIIAPYNIIIAIIVFCLGILLQLYQILLRKSKIMQ